MSQTDLIKLNILVSEVENDPLGISCVYFVISYGLMSSSHFTPNLVMIVPSSYGSILSSVLLIFLGKFVKCDKTKFTYDDSRLADRESYLSRNSLDYSSYNSTSSVQNQLRTQGNEQTNQSQVRRYRSKIG
ncbi:unnamed protein product [Orchesella dallaii]|uniref:Uncharacterized protein n=1 Tax=Orchesella dallaii TaxID=48710 RepID=A0ABP1QYP9_9HEXA